MAASKKSDAAAGLVNAEQRILAAIVDSGLPPALSTSSAENSYDVYWSIIARRSGAKLQVHTSNEPTMFAAMAHAKPQTAVALGKIDKGTEWQVLRRAAEVLVLPEAARAIPFSLLEGTRAKRVCGVAFHRPLVAAAVVKGHSHDNTASLQAIVLGEQEVAAVGIDGNSQRFGAVPLRRPVNEVMQADVDQKYLTLTFSDASAQWSLEEAPPEEIEATLSLFRRLKVPIRRLVQVDATTRQFQLE